MYWYIHTRFHLFPSRTQNTVSNSPTNRIPPHPQGCAPSSTIIIDINNGNLSHPKLINNPLATCTVSVNVTAISLFYSIVCQICVDECFHKPGDQVRYMRHFREAWSILHRSHRLWKACRWRAYRERAIRRALSLGKSADACVGTEKWLYIAWVAGSLWGGLLLYASVVSVFHGPLLHCIAPIKQNSVDERNLHQRNLTNT